MTAPLPHPGVEQSDPQAEQLTRSFVLLVDDTPANLTVMVDLLEAEGHRVEVARSGAEGIRLACAQQPDLILLDVVMPGENGFSVCRRLRSTAEAAHIPVIFMTSLDDLQSKLEGFAAGGVDYVAKPVRLPEVLSRVRTHLELSSLRRRLAAQNVELRAARDELEERVRIRTAALTAEIAERHRAERELHRSAEQIRDLYNNAPCGYHSLDADGVCVQINDTQLNWLGYTREEFVGRPVTQFLLRKSALQFVKAFQLVKKRGWIRDIELQWVRRDGSILPGLVRATAVHDAEGRFVMTRSTVYDLSERKQSEEVIRHMAHHDPLTGLANRTLFQRRLAQMLGQARRRREMVATMFLDLEQFNQINDAFGHHVGDMALREISKRLSGCLRETDSLARWGGDEFVLALVAPEVEQTAGRVAQSMLASLREPVYAENHELHLSGSVGISLYPRDGLDTQTLLRAADTAMYHAKENGPGTVELFTPALTANVQHRTSLAAQLHGARARNEIYLQYQPQVDLRTGRIVGAEALMRWNNRELGIVCPAEFIPIAEDIGLIHELGEWAFGEACSQLQQWRKAGNADLTIAINLSVRQLADPNVAERLAIALEAAGLPGEAVEIEITENLLMEPTEAILRVLRCFSDLGMRLTIDDFGVGYSSLSYLQRFPISALKIDRSFVSRIGLAPNDDAIIEAIIGLAQSLQMRILAEGVETQAQIDFLRSRGCPIAQGYHFSPAVDPERLMELLKRT